MPFGTITSQAVDYNPRAAGEYHKDGLGFSDPRDYFSMRGGSLRRDGLRSAGIVRALEKDVTVGSGTERRSASLVLNIIIPDDDAFTAAELDSLATDLSTFLTSDTINRLILGEV